MDLREACLNVNPKADPQNLRGLHRSLWSM
jgi:hypothetical protein